MIVACSSCRGGGPGWHHGARVVTSRSGWLAGVTAWREGLAEEEELRERIESLKSRHGERRKGSIVLGGVKYN